MDNSSSIPSPSDRQAALLRGKNIKLLLLDVDGVLTDGSLLYTGSEKEGKSFNTQDGFGIRLLHDAGIDVGVITARRSTVVHRRASELNMRFIHQGAVDKNIAFAEIVAASGLTPAEIAYMGDDWLDIIVLQQVGLAVAPANGAPEVTEIVHYITRQEGGHGAVRECCNLILEAQNLTAELLQKYTI